MSSRKLSEVKHKIDEETSTSRSQSRRTHNHRHKRSRSRSRERRSRSRDRRSRSKDRRSRSRDRRSRSRNRHKNRYLSHSRKERNESKVKRSEEHKKVNIQNEANNMLDINMPLPPEPPNISQKSYNNSNKDEDYNNYNVEEEPIDKERIHREMEEKLRLALAREGKVYPPKKSEASHPVFANDGSFIEIFKKIQEQTAITTASSTTTLPLAANNILSPQVLSVVSPATAPYVAASAAGRSAPPPPLVGRRRGGKILKTGVVAKQRLNGDSANSDPKDFWALYLAEVNKYKNTACETETGNRPLVK